MTVVISEHDIYAPRSDTKPSCTVCGIDHLHYPFLWWQGETDICICRWCCAKIKAGFTADLVQVAAIVEMQAVNSAYSTSTLQRRSPVDLKADREREKREEEDRMRWFQEGWDARETESAKAAPVNGGEPAETKH
jgi:hypothetical protein